MFARDIAGDFALHHAIRHGNVICVKKLLDSLPADSNDYLQENGLNQTVLDTAILALQKFLQSNNQGGSKDMRAAAVILKLVYDTLGYERKLSQYKYVRGITEIMIQQTIQECEKKQKAKKPHYYGYRPQPEKGRWTHNCSIDNPGNINLPSFVFEKDPEIQPKSVSTKGFIEVIA